MTIELWVKDTNSLNGQTQVIFENSLDGVSPLIQIGILTGPTPYARSIFCVPLKASNPQTIVQSGNLTTLNVWHHISCNSDALNNLVSLLIFNSTNQVVSSFNQSNI
jgi:hypothetical protein